jgi:hypothetical protein
MRPSDTGVSHRPTNLLVVSVACIARKGRGGYGSLYGARYW